MDLWPSVGTKVQAFRGSNDSLGAMIVQFENVSEMLEAMDYMERDVRIEVD